MAGSVLVKAVTTCGPETFYCVLVSRTSWNPRVPTGAGDSPLLQALQNLGQLLVAAHWVRATASTSVLEFGEGDARRRQRASMYDARWHGCFFCSYFQIVSIGFADAASPR